MDGGLGRLRRRGRRVAGMAGNLGGRQQQQWSLDALINLEGEFND